MRDTAEPVAGDAAAEQARGRPRGAAAEQAPGAVHGASIRQVRSFNRSFTQRVGALNDGYLARGRPLGASRVLWEIGADGTDLRCLRARLDLDSGYLSRLVRS